MSCAPNKLTEPQPLSYHHLSYGFGRKGQQTQNFVVKLQTNSTITSNRLQVNTNLDKNRQPHRRSNKDNFSSRNISTDPLDNRSQSFLDNPIGKLTSNHQRIFSKWCPNRKAFKIKLFYQQSYGFSCAKRGSKGKLVALPLQPIQDMLTCLE